MLMNYQHLSEEVISEIATRITANGTTKALPSALSPGDKSKGSNLDELKKAICQIVEHSKPVQGPLMHTGFSRLHAL